MIEYVEKVTGRDKVVTVERVDKNGTQHIYIETDCSRCGGQGGSRAWNHTGWTCYKCGGKGRETKKAKIYTKEHYAKLQEQRKKREEKKRQEAIANAKQRNIEWREDTGLQNDTVHLVLGNTYEIKEELKEAGAKFRREPITGWYLSEANEKFPTVELEVEKILRYTELGEAFISWCEEVREYVYAQIEASKPKKEESKSEYVGEVGQRLRNIKLKVEKVVSYDSFYGNMYINIMSDEEGNIYVWKSGTSVQYDADDNDIVELKGATIKEHTEYNNEVKQTVLTRCLVVEREHEWE